MLQLFISYCHADGQYVDSLLTHLDPIIKDENALISPWYDREIISGKELWNNIDTHLHHSDIFCPLISASYLSSQSCRKEFEAAYEMHNRQGMLIIPIILSACAWKENEKISKFCAATTDAKEINHYTNQEDAWFEVYTNIKKAVIDYQNILNLKFTDSFNDFLSNTDILTKTHNQKETLVLDDIFVYPEVSYKNQSLYETHSDSKEILAGFKKGDRVEIIGDEQSGKTTIAKKYICELKKKGFIPIYISADQPILQGNLQARINNSFEEQYNSSLPLCDYDFSKIVPIIDDFFKAKRIEDYIIILNDYDSSIIIVDDIFLMDCKNETITSDYTKYTIREMNHRLRNQLIKKWLMLSDGGAQNRIFTNEEYARLDETYHRIDGQLSQGVMPAYPFFILFLLSTYETMQRPLDKEITTQGYCYQSLIYFFLAKQHVASEDQETYLNFLSELSYAIFKNQGNLDYASYEKFLQAYKKQFNLTQSPTTMLEKLVKCGIMHVSSLRYYGFAYPYLYYFFAGKYFAEHSDASDEENKEAIEDIDRIFANLHKDEYAYIAVFIAHHSKSKKILAKLYETAQKYFNAYNPTLLESEELAFFNTKVLEIPSLPETNNPEEQREKALRRQDELEEKKRSIEEHEDELSTDISKQLRGSIKTVEVIGQILRNRAGSMPKTDLKNMTNCAIDVHLRLLSSFFELIQTIIKSDASLVFIKERILEKKPDIDEQSLDALASAYFWNMNMSVIIGIISKLTFALGCNNMLPIIGEVCDERANTAARIIKNNSYMWIAKTINIEDIKTLVSASSNNPTIQKVMKYMLVNYCTMHNIDYKDRLRLQQLGIDRRFLNNRDNSKKKLMIDGHNPKGNEEPKQ